MTTRLTKTKDKSDAGKSQFEVLNDNALIEEGVAVEQVDLYCSSVVPSLISASLLSMILAFLFWGKVSNLLLPLWLLYQGLVSLFRYMTVRAFWNCSNKHAEISLWRRRMVLGAFLAGAGWGVGNVLLYQTTEVDYRILVVCTLPAICAIAAGILSILPHAFPAFMFPVMIPFVILNLAMNNWLGYGLTAFSVLFIITLLSSSRRIQATMGESLRLGYQNRLLRELADAASNAKSDFLSSVSHELRTPMTSVFGFSKLIKKKVEQDIMPCLKHCDAKVLRSAEQIQSNLDVIVSEGERLTSLINNVLDLSKLDAGKMEWSMAPVNLVETINHVVAVTTPLVQSKGILLALNVESCLPEITGDRDRLVQVLVNLVSNSVKFTPEGAITISARQDGDELMLSVADTGIGIADENLEKVFDKFHQIGDTLTDKPRGTGLGLAICREIIARHGGNIWVESELGKGSIFCFTLPVVLQSVPPRI